MDASTLSSIRITINQVMSLGFTLLQKLYQSIFLTKYFDVEQGRSYNVQVDLEVRTCIQQLLQCRMDNVPDWLHDFNRASIKDGMANVHLESV